MNFEYPYNTLFCAKNDIRNKGKISDEVRQRREFLRSHKFYIEKREDGSEKIIVKKLGDEETGVWKMVGIIKKPSVFEVKASENNYDSTINKLNEIRLSKTFLEECLGIYGKYHK